MDYRPLIAKYFPANQVENALRVMMGESSGDPKAHATQGEDSRGLFQLNIAQSANPQLAQYDLYDPETNIRLAAQMYSERGWQPWTVAHKLGIVNKTPQEGAMAQPAYSPNQLMDEFWIDLENKDKEGRPLVYDHKPGPGANFWDPTPKTRHVRRIIEDDGRIFDVSDDGTKKYVRTDPQAAAKAPVFREDPAGLQMWDEDAGRLVPAPGATPKAPTGTYVDVIAPNTTAPNIVLQRPDGTIETKPNPNYIKPENKPNIVTRGNTAYEINRDPTTGQTSVVPLYTFPAEPEKPQTLTPYQSWEIATKYPEETTYKQERARIGDEQWAEGNRLEDLRRNQDREAQNMRQGMTNYTSAWNQALAYQLPEGTEYLPNFEPGGAYDQLMSRYGTTTTPLRATRVPFDPWRAALNMKPGG